MIVKEILGINLQYFFNDRELWGTDIFGEKTYSGKKYEVWEISDKAYKIMSDMTDEEFYKLYPLTEWAFASGSNMGEPEVDYIINEQPIKAWDGEQRLSWKDDECVDCSDYLEGRCSATDEDVSGCYYSRKWYNLTDYFSYEIPVGELLNICALAVDLAKYNNMTLGELFTKYEGSADNK